MFDLLDFEQIFRSPGPWVMIFIVCLIFLLIRLVTDLRKEVTVAREETVHFVNQSFLAHYTELNNIKQLARIRDAYRRAYSKGGSGRMDLEIQAEIDRLKSATRQGAGYVPNGQQPGAEEELYDDDLGY